MNKKLLGAGAALLLVACGGGSSGGGGQDLTQLDPRSCNGLWAIEVVNRSQFPLEVFWAPSVMQTRARVGDVQPQDSRIWFKRSPVDEIPEVWVVVGDASRTEIGVRNEAAQRSARLQIAVGCDPRGQPGSGSDG